MVLDYTNKKEVKMDMREYVRGMLETFPITFKPNQTAVTTASEKLFEKGSGKILEMKRKEIFHTTVAKGLFLCKRARPDIQQAITLLCTRVQSPNESDWN